MSPFKMSPFRASWHSSDQQPKDVNSENSNYCLEFVSGNVCSPKGKLPRCRISVLTVFEFLSHLLRNSWASRDGNSGFGFFAFCGQKLLWACLKAPTLTGYVGDAQLTWENICRYGSNKATQMQGQAVIRDTFMGPALWGQTRNVCTNICGSKECYFNAKMTRSENQQLFMFWARLVPSDLFPQWPPEYQVVGFVCGWLGHWLFGLEARGWESSCCLTVCDQSSVRPFKMEHPMSIHASWNVFMLHHVQVSWCCWCTNLGPHVFGVVSTTPDPNTPAKVWRYKWEPYRDTNGWCISQFQRRRGDAFAEVSQ